MNLYMLSIRAPSLTSPVPVALVRAPTATDAARLARLLSGNKAWENARAEEIARDVVGPQAILFTGIETHFIR